MFDDDKFGGLGVYALPDDGKFGSLQVHMMCAMMISLEVCKFTCCV